MSYRMHAGCILFCSVALVAGCDAAGDGLNPDNAVADAAQSADSSSRADGGVIAPDSAGGRDATAPTDSATQPEASGGQGEPAELAGITMAHNRARLAENAGLPQLTWDPALAAIAAAWGAKCQDTDQPIGLIDHNPGRSNGYPAYVGENIYGGPDPIGAVDLWMAEKSSYNLATNQCSGVCGHYTQIVWKATTKVGCAISRCPSLRYSNSIICNYGPGGNAGGQKPY
jgi:pathogenesis-related protein 1